VAIALLIGLEIASTAGIIAGLIIAAALPLTVLMGRPKHTAHVKANDFFGVSLLNHEISGTEGDDDFSKMLLDASRNYSYRNEAIKRITDLPPELWEGLKASKWQLVDMMLYFTYEIATNTYVQIINDADKKDPGLTNVNSGKLDENTYFLMCGIRMLYGTGEIKNTTWANISGKAVLANGEFTIIHGNSTMIPRSSNRIFDTKNDMSVWEGYYQLANPKWLKPGVKTDVNVWLSGAGVDGDNVRFEIYGAAIFKA